MIYSENDIKMILFHLNTTQPLNECLLVLECCSVLPNNDFHNEIKNSYNLNGMNEEGINSFFENMKGYIILNTETKEKYTTGHTVNIGNRSFFLSLRIL